MTTSKKPSHLMLVATPSAHHADAHSTAVNYFAQLQLLLLWYYHSPFLWWCVETKKGCRCVAAYDSGGNFLSCRDFGPQNGCLMDGERTSLSPSTTR